jgi:hypothetical protein
MRRYDQLAHELTFRRFNVKRSPSWNCRAGARGRNPTGLIGQVDQEIRLAQMHNVGSLSRTALLSDNRPYFHATKGADFEDSSLPMALGCVRPGADAGVAAGRYAHL